MSMTWNSTIVSIGPILQGALKVPMTFLEVLSYAFTVKGEGMIVSISRSTVRAALIGQTIKADPLSISTTRTLAPMHSMVICKGLVWVALLGGRSSLEKARRGCEEPSTPIRDKTSYGVVSIGTSFPFKMSKRALCFWKAKSEPHMDT